MNKQRMHFPNLNGLRFIASFLVIIHHIEQIKSIFSIENYWETSPFIRDIGKHGVLLFFVLSGFLITYLLLAEERSYKTINIKQFYLRRILRIWPLYFLIVILALFILPNINFFIWPSFSKEIVYTNLTYKLFLYITFFPNLVLLVFGIVPYASQTWSLGVEEQYYLIWPVFLNYFKKNRILFMLCIILFSIAFTLILSTRLANFFTHKDLIRAFWLNYSIDCMVIGGIYATLLFQKSILLKLLLNRIIFFFTSILVFFLIFKGVHGGHPHSEVYAVLFGIIILNFAANDKIKISLENRLFNYLGRISYGLYMYHPIAIVSTLTVVVWTKLITNWFIYPLSFLLTIMMAGFSHKYFETFFLKLKNKSSNVIEYGFLKTQA